LLEPSRCPTLVLFSLYRIPQRMIAWFQRRYLDVLGSIYIYNEHRGYTAIDRVL